jgi:hypothetical protein
MRCLTRKNSWTIALATTASQILCSNPRRKSIILSPVAGGIGGSPPITAVAFAAGANQLWTVPNGVTSLIDIYHWGSGGNAGAAGGALGGGGGGGGSFATCGSLTVTPGSVWNISVNAAGAASTASILGPSGTAVTTVGDGANGANQTGGTKGASTVGVIKTTGGNGFTANNTSGGGGGGAGGNNSNGAASAGRPGGAGGGAATILTYGLGGNGGTGGLANANGTAATSPGGGGSGGGSTTGTSGAASDGLAVIFYTPSISSQCISVAQDPNVALGLGSLNYLAGATFPTVITDHDIGHVIYEPWFAISGVAGLSLFVQEYSYGNEPYDLAKVIEALTR